VHQIAHKSLNCLGNFRNNFVYNNGRQAGEGGCGIIADGSNILIYNNLIYNNIYDASSSSPGGEGIVREIEFLEPGELSLMGERRRHQPWGLAGGAPGACGEDWLIHRDGTRDRLPGKVTLSVEAGERLRVQTPGGGGWGTGG